MYQESAETPDQRLLCVVLGKRSSSLWVGEPACMTHGRHRRPSDRHWKAVRRPRYPIAGTPSRALRHRVDSRAAIKPAAGHPLSKSLNRCRESLGGRQAREIGCNVGRVVSTQGELLGVLDCAADDAFDLGFQLSCRFDGEYLHLFCMTAVAGCLEGLLACRRISGIRGNAI